MFNAVAMTVMACLTVRLAWLTLLFVLHLFVINAVAMTVMACLTVRLAWLALLFVVHLFVINADGQSDFALTAVCP